MAILTYAEVFRQIEAPLPPHLSFDDIIAVETRFWAQGDVYARCEPEWLPLLSRHESVSARQIRVVEGGAGRHAHILDCPNGLWYPGQFRQDTRFPSDFGVLWVPDRDLATLTHTGEHGSIALAPGSWRLWGQIEFAGEIRRVMD